MKKGLYVSTGLLSLSGGLLFFAAMFLLVKYFGYPNIIRAEPSILLGRLYEQKEIVPFIYYLGIGVGGICVLFATLLSRKVFELQGDEIWSYLGSFCGLLSGFLLYTGIIRYTFLFPFLAEKRVLGIYDAAVIDAIFQAFNQYVGNSLAEHAQFTFTSLYLVCFGIAILTTKLVPRWVAFLGFIFAAVIIYGNGEFFGLPGAFIANRIGSGLMALWLVTYGISLIWKSREQEEIGS